MHSYEVSPITKYWGVCHVQLIHVLSKAYPKMGPKTQDFWWNSRPETRDPSCGRDRGPNTRDPKGEKRDQRPETHLIGETQNPRPRTL